MVNILKNNVLINKYMCTRLDGGKLFIYACRMFRLATHQGREFLSRIIMQEKVFVIITSGVRDIIIYGRLRNVIT